MHESLARIRTGAISLAAIFLTAVCAYHFLADYPWIEAVWLVVITISTVGFGEHSEGNSTVQLITIGLILLGVSAAAYAIGGFIQLALAGEIQKAMGRKKMTREISRLRNHVVICGFGRLGQDLAERLEHRDQHFVIIDSDSEVMHQTEELARWFVTGDATDDEVLEESNLQYAKAIVTALPSDADNVFITLTARALNPDIQIIAKAERDSSCRKLRQAGADKIVMPHRVGAQQMERMISRPSTADLVELFAETSHLDMEFDEFQISGDCELVGKSLAESNVKQEFNLLVVGIKNESGDFRFNPVSSMRISARDTVLVMGDVAEIKRFKTMHA